MANTFELVQTQLSALGDKVVDTTVVGEFKTEALARDWLTKRGYRFDAVAGAWINGNTVQFPIEIVTKEKSIFDIKSFV